MFLHFKEGQITMSSTRLLETELVYNRGQDLITLNWRSYQQIQRGKRLQQTGPYLEV